MLIDDCMHHEVQCVGTQTVISQPLIVRDTYIDGPFSIIERVNFDHDHGHAHSTVGCNQFYLSR